MVVFDTSVLALAFDVGARVPTDPVTGCPLLQCKERIDYLLAILSQGKKRVLIPTPALAEYLVWGGLDKDKRLHEFSASKAFVVAAFDLRAAVECSMIEDGESRKGKRLTETESKAKVKFDRQIIAIAIARGAKTVYTGDHTLAARARENNLIAVMTWEIPLPPVKSQMEIEYVEVSVSADADEC